MSETQTTGPTYTVTADDPKTNLPVIRAQLTAEGASAEVDRLRAQGMDNIKVTPVSNAAGSVG